LVDFPRGVAVDMVCCDGYLKRLSQNHLVAIKPLGTHTNEKGAGTYISSATHEDILRDPAGY
jgi:hypothetical protein